MLHRCLILTILGILALRLSHSFLIQCNLQRSMENSLRPHSSLFMSFPKKKTTKKIKKVKPFQKKIIKKVVSKPDTRFVLGNGVDCIPPTTLLKQVKSTAPYYFYDKTAQSRLTDDTNLLDVSNGQHHMSLFSHVTSRNKEDVVADIVQLSDSSDGWLNILKAYEYESSLFPGVELRSSLVNRVAYFALCWAAHFSTVATYVPTDVDSKIRGHCWYDPDEEVIQAQYKIVKASLKWNVDDVSNRNIPITSVNRRLKPYIASGHIGEWLSVMIGAWGAFIRLGREELATEAEGYVESELELMTKSFLKLRDAPPSEENDKLLLQLCAVMTHNVGDIDQGLSYWFEYKDKVPSSQKGGNNTIVENLAAAHKFSKLAHERFERYDGVVAKDLYKLLLATEGHRNYPLREVKSLRQWKELQLPIGPWLEQWGATVIKHPKLSSNDKVDVIRMLLRGCDVDAKPHGIPNQIGYYRALHGVFNTLPIEELAEELSQECSNVLTSDKMKTHLALSESEFAQSLGKKARKYLKTL